MRLAGQQTGDETMRTLVEQMRKTVGSKSTESLYVIVRALGMQQDVGATTARYLCLSEIERRLGEKACDALMAEIGM